MAKVAMPDTHTAIITTMGDGLLPLHIWLSPSFPTGGFAYSHGLEWAVEAGDIKAAASLAAWLKDLVAHGTARADMVLLALAWAEADRRSTNDLALALCSTYERRLETCTQGNAFLMAVRNAWPLAMLDEFAAALGEDDVAYPVAVAVAAAGHHLPLRAVLEVFGLNVITNLVSAVVRLGPIGQSEAQKVIAQLCPVIAEAARFAETADRDNLGTAGWRSDIAAMRHETQYSRLFRS
jgi:urease accessory protein